jgi:hypothetical protein
MRSSPLARCAWRRSARRTASPSRSSASPQSSCAPPPRLSGRARAGGRAASQPRAAAALHLPLARRRRAAAWARPDPTLPRRAGSPSARPGAAPHRQRQRVDQADLDRRVARGQVCAARRRRRRGGRLRGHRSGRCRRGARMAARAPPCGGRVTASPGAPAAGPAPKQQHRSLLIAFAAAPARNIPCVSSRLQRWTASAVKCRLSCSRSQRHVCEAHLCGRECWRRALPSAFAAGTLAAFSACMTYFIVRLPAAVLAKIDS